MKLANKKVITNMRLLSSGIVVLATLLYAAMLLPVRAGTMSAGLYISVLSSLMQVLSMLTWNYAAYMEDYESDRLYAEDLKRFLALPEAAKTGKHFEMPSVQSITFDDVTFYYPGCEQPTLKHLSFTLEGGRRYGFVGKNGAGKTTLIKLLTGLYSDYEGEIRINGVELREMDNQTRTSLFSTIYQDFARYEVSAWENLTLGCQSKPEQGEVTAILDALGLSERLRELPDGLDTDLGRLNDVGVDFSGGEWQRIAIARSLLRRAPVQIMDEPTASLDPTHERDIFQLTQKLFQGDISLLVTHRLGGVRNVDHIIVLDHGAVCEEGTHEELMRRGGLYAELYSSQKEWYE